MICTLTEQNGHSDWCEWHKMRHRGHYRVYALDPGEKGQKFRDYWDEQKAGNKHIDKPLPGIITRARNYIATLAEHTANGSKLVPLPIRQERAATCEPCQYRNREFNACSICGCPLTEDNKLGDKLSWEVAKCPDNRWPMRHLLHHLWPRKLSTGTWQRNLDQLKQRWWMFNGKRIIAVATSTDSHTFEAVQAYMKGYDCEWIHVENDGGLREVKTFRPLFDRVAEFTGPEHYTFYCQGKGVTKPVNDGVSIHAWTTAMYETALDYWPLVKELLQTKPIAGSFKKCVPGAFDGSPCDWHYSGSFCWLKNSELFRRNWTDIEQVWFGIESWPSRIFTRDEAACLFFERDKQFNLYNVKYWEFIDKEFRKWRESHKHQRTVQVVR